ncbi:hypothetical protein ACLK17_24260 [Escherichia coli]
MTTLAGNLADASLLSLAPLVAVVFALLPLFHVFRRQHSVTSLYFCQLSACYWRCYSAVY